MIIKRALIILIIIVGLINNSNGQEKYITESSTHIFWQSDRQLTKDDFKGNGSTNPKFIKYCDELDLCTSAFIGVFAVLDIPKKKRKRGEFIEKAYFVPAFEKNTSYILNNDTTGIRKQKIVFDIYELSTRFARQQLTHFQDSMPSYGITTIMFKTVESRAIEMRTKLINSYTNDIYIEKIEGAYKLWRNRINKMLSDSEEYATRPQDCYRFVKNEPIEKGYIKARNVVGNLDKK